MDDNVELPVIKGLDLAKGLEITQNNKGLYLKLLRKFKASQHDFLQKFEEAVESDKISEALLLAHTLKGTAGNIGATELFKSALTLEELCKKKSETSVIMEHFGTLAKIFRPFMDALEALDRRSDTASEEKQSDTGEVMQKLDAVQELIENYDTQAIELIDELRSELIVKRYNDVFEGIVHALSLFDFDEALEQLTQLKLKINDDRENIDG